MLLFKFCILITCGRLIIIVIIVMLTIIIKDNNKHDKHLHNYMCKT